MNTFTSLFAASQTMFIEIFHTMKNFLPKDGSTKKSTGLDIVVFFIADNQVRSRFISQ